MKRLLLCSFVFWIVINCPAQSALDKVYNGVNTAERAQGTLNKVKGLFGKKKKQEPESSSAAVKDTIRTVKSEAVSGISTTYVSVAGIDFSTLKKLTENIQACSGVETAKMKYSSSLSSVEVIHTGKTEELFKLMLETSKDIFSEKNVESFEEGKISISLKR